MKTFRDWFLPRLSRLSHSNQGAMIEAEHHLEECWTACAREYEHELKNKEQALKLKSDAFELLKKKNEELQKVIDGDCNENPFDFSQYCQSLHYGYGKEIEELKKKNEELEKKFSILLECIDELEDEDDLRTSPIIKKARHKLDEVKND
jgi:hypothetical protein